MTAWTVKDNAGQLLPAFVCASRLEVGRKVVPAHYDAFRLHVSRGDNRMAPVFPSWLPFPCLIRPNRQRR